MNKRHYEHTLPNIRGSLSNTYRDEKCSDEELRHSVNGVLRMGTAIIELARKEKKEEVR